MLSVVEVNKLLLLKKTLLARNLILGLARKFRIARSGGHGSHPITPSSNLQVRPGGDHYCRYTNTKTAIINIILLIATPFPTKTFIILKAILFSQGIMKT